MITYQKSREGLKYGLSGVAWKHIVGGMNNRNEYNLITSDNKGQVEEVGIDNRLNNSNNSQVTYYITGVYITGDWIDWYNVPFNLTVFYLCIPGCGKTPTTRKRLGERMKKQCTRISHQVT